MLKLIVSLCLVFSILAAKSIIAQLAFEKIYGGSGDDYGYSVQQTLDGGYIITGMTRSFGAGLSDVYLIKTNPSGDTLWTRTYGGNLDDEGRFVHQTTDGGYIIAGTTESFGAGSADIWLIKTNSSGETIWTRTFGGSDEDRCYSGNTTADGGYCIVGSTSSFPSDVYLIRTDSLGSTLWSKTYGSSEHDIGYSVQETFDGGYIIGGWTYSPSLTPVFLIKTDSQGDTLWTKKYIPPYFWIYTMSTQQTSDSGYIVTTTYGRADQHGYLIKTNSSGDTLWTRNWLGFANSINLTMDGGFIISGHPTLIKTDSSGDTLWTRAFFDCIGMSVQQTTDDGYIVVGLTNLQPSNICLIKTFGDGTVDVRKLADEYVPTEFQLEQNFPNPFNPTTTISWQSPVGSWQTLKIYDVLGREIANLVDEYKPAGNYEIEFNASGLSSGVYFYRLQAGDPSRSSGQGFVDTKKLILLR